MIIVNNFVINFVKSFIKDSNSYADVLHNGKRLTDSYLENIRPKTGL